LSLLYSIMEKLVRTFIAENKKPKENFTKELFAKLDSMYSVGIDAYTESGKEIFESEKSITVHIKVKSKSEYEIVGLNSGAKIFRTFKSPSSKKNEEKKTIIVHNEFDDEFYPIDNDFDPYGYDYYRYEVIGYNDPQMKPVDYFTLMKEEYREICEPYGINAENCVYSANLVARDFTFKNIGFLHGASHVTDKEFKILEGSVRGAFTYARKNQIIKDCYDYDLNNAYNYLQSQTDFMFPLRESTSLYIKSKHRDNSLVTKDNELVIAKLKILGEHKYWKATNDNYYNSYHIQLLDRLGIKYEVEEVYRYLDCVKTKELFTHLQHIYDCKVKGNSHAKDVSTIGWGLHAKAHDKRKHISELKPKDFTKILSHDPNTHMVEVKKEGRQYKHVTARIKPFLLAYGRLHLIDILLKVEEAGYQIYQSNTDGFVSNITPEEMAKIYPISKQLGHLKVKQQFKGTHIIRHIRLIEPIE
jgi:hypothetical protein